ncbi:hypothetical protein [Treponema phagedenis]|uniref:Uncharacterized protein n=1 Tax=Treponema phagedenis TaxID=162 RepID=A0AAE6M7N7_TREPH|nr:hypothetical protein [Treponema phagedenis]NVP23610.1 hypothetical protein [Treponema phagedenis]QEJ98743.1 hypothetical protein FUT82_12550 [Treponema phagedenis]QEK04248.1 hypothetical protein FUT83_10835 [Treponema phagedenis]QEK09863.1 hypothetical protein FUT81_10750 [Treponema phagedenis]QLC58441.1 hypothetical protein HW453_06165 [Treponema phagedenis]
MIITKNENFRNTAKPSVNFEYRLRPKTQEEAQYIKYLLKLKGYSCTDVGLPLDITKGTVLNVVSGRRRSRKVEAEIARLLGRSDWNEVVIEARLAVSNPAYRPTKKDIDEYKAEVAARFRERAEQKQRIIESLAPMREAVGAIKNQRR